MLFGFLYVLCIFLSVSTKGSSLTPAVVLIWNYPPNEYCDTEDKWNQDEFYGSEVEIGQDFVDATGWNGTKYDIDYYCLSAVDEIANGMEGWYEEAYGREYLFTV